MNPEQSEDLPDTPAAKQLELMGLTSATEEPGPAAPRQDLPDMPAEAQREAMGLTTAAEAAATPGPAPDTPLTQAGANAVEPEVEAYLADQAESS